MAYLAPNIMIRYIMIYCSFRCILNPNILRERIALKRIASKAVQTQAYEVFVRPLYTSDSLQSRAARYVCNR